MKVVLIFTALFMSVLSYSRDMNSPERPSYVVLSDEFDESLWLRQSKITVIVTANDIRNFNSILYGYDNFTNSKQLNDDNAFSFRMRPGEYEFAFYADSTYYEIFTNTIKVQAQHHITIQLNFKSTYQIQMVRKPVIYIYSDQFRELNVSVNPAGKMIFTYPFTDDNSWDVQVDSNGMIVDGEYLNYLFWEAAQKIDPASIDYSEGVVIKGNEAQFYLEASLTSLGFSAKEKADFITFWAPQMLNCESVFLQLIIDEDCSVFGELNISPAPTSIHRVYLVWKADPTGVLNPTPQEFHKLTRSEFDVLEWGGVQIIDNQNS